jgi:hypothetical protein
MEIMWTFGVSIQNNENSAIRDGGYTTHIETSQVRLELPRQDLQCRRLASTVGPDQAEDLPWSRDG